MPLAEQQIVTPIRPFKTFSFDDIPGAFRYMRGANHMGKIVITHGSSKDTKVSVGRASFQNYRYSWLTYTGATGPPVSLTPQ